MTTLKPLINKLLKADDERITRLHDRKGNIVPFARATVNGSMALASYLMWRMSGRRPIRPWISYDAQKVIGSLLRKKRCSVLEFGSGMSTLLFSQRAGKVSSIENDRYWHETVAVRLGTAGQVSAKMDYQYTPDRETYTRFKSSSGESFDVLLVDGPWRAECLRNHMNLVNDGGIIYLDNTDADSSSGVPGELDIAVDLLLEFAKEHDATTTWFTDFSPTSLFVSQGLLIEMPRQ